MGVVTDLVSFKFRSVYWVLAGLLWLSLIAAGLSILWKYDNTPGQSAQAPSIWPSESCIPRTSERHTLVLLAHPRCPCTRASLGELDRLLAQSHDSVNVFVLFYQPYQAGGLPKDYLSQWTKTDLWQTAAAIPGVRVLPDPEGREAQLFQATTSGQALLYDAAGQLVFAGGITDSRGHAGDNVGSSAILKALDRAHTARPTGGTAEHMRTKVFGCALFDAPGTRHPGGVQKCDL
jgi:hypothetical protein